MHAARLMFGVVCSLATCPIPRYEPPDLFAGLGPTERITVHLDVGYDSGELAVSLQETSRATGSVNSALTAAPTH